MSPPDRLEDRLRHELTAVRVDTPLEAGLAAVDHRRRRRRTRRALVAAALTGVVVITASVARWDQGGGSQRIDVVDVPTTLDRVGGEAQVPLGHVSVPVDTPAPEDPAITLTPAGPYTDGQAVTVSVPTGFTKDWFYEGAPQLCLTIDDYGGEVCDPTWSRGPAQPAVGAVRDTVVVDLTSRVFTPTGWRRCGEPGLRCRLVVMGADGTYRASPELTFVSTPDAAPPSVTLSVEPSPVSEGGEVVLRPAGLRADPSWLAARQSDRARIQGENAFWVQVCALQARRANCNWVPIAGLIDPDHPDAPVTLHVTRELFGFHGWDDCAAVPCYVSIRRQVINAVTPDAVVGTDLFSTAAPLRFDDRVPPDPRPSITLVEPGPYRVGQRVTARVTGLPPTGSPTPQVAVALCHGDPTAMNDCAYLGNVLSSSVAISNDLAIDLPAGAGIAAQVPCTGTTCFLALMPGGDGLGPLATVPIEISP